MASSRPPHDRIRRRRWGSLPLAPKRTVPVPTIEIEIEIERRMIPDFKKKFFEHVAQRRGPALLLQGRVRCSRLVRWGRSRRIRGHAGVPRFANPKEGTVSGLWRFNYGVKDALNCVTFDKRSTSLEDEEE
ncbi:hypothetical protein B296_00055648 [Ensete ventricosum]|uniref:Uncharacterized protein n=1 Tax=Ensete ventricosum TaxID=4639 RepID=A0A426XF99_ENSVE|nr:hypothetical protein B296_00055648 [Ensete ventricosum]